MIEYPEPKGGEALLKREVDTAMVQLKKLRPIPKVKINNPEDVVKLVREMEDYDREKFKVIWLDRQNRVIGVENISEGTLSAALVHPREAIKGALLANSAGVILAHNHPSGDPKPSMEDADVTGNLYRAFKLMNIDVLDAMIIGKEGYYSFRDKGMLSSLESGGSRVMESNGNEDACSTAMRAALSVIEEQCGGERLIDIEGVKIKVMAPESVMQVMEGSLTLDQRIDSIQQSTWAQNEAAGLCGKLFALTPGTPEYTGCVTRVSRRLAEGMVGK